MKKFIKILEWEYMKFNQIMMKRSQIVDWHFVKNRNQLFFQKYLFQRSERQ
jgi:hypothetical protein